jgi:DNA-binding transcriptional MerR regulator
MTKREFTIGEAAKRTGLSIKTIRFYSDKGLIPEAERSAANYRIYSDEDLVRLDLIVLLRRAGLRLAEIQAVLVRKLPLKEALQLRLAAVQAQITSLRRIEAALRLALRSEPNFDDLRRVWAMTKLSTAELRTAVQRFYDTVSDGAGIDHEWKNRLIEASVPDLPDDPTPAQIDAYVELSEILSDPKFVENMRAQAADVWDASFDRASFCAATSEAVRQAAVALEEGMAPHSPEAKPIVDAYVAGFAKSMNRQPDRTFTLWVRNKFASHDPRGARYWRLVAVLRGQNPQNAPQSNEWDWLSLAIQAHLPTE